MEKKYKAGFWDLNGAGTIGGLVLLVAFVVWLGMTNKGDSKPVANNAVVVAPARQTKFDAYGMCCQFIKNQLNLAETPAFHISPNECTDYGDNEWIIVGSLDIVNAYGVKINKRWTADIKYDGKQYWSLVYPVVYSK